MRRLLISAVAVVIVALAVAVAVLAIVLLTGDDGSPVAEPAAVEPVAEPVAVPAAEPTAVEPVAEPVAVPAAEPAAVKPVAAPAAVPAAEPAAVKPVAAPVAEPAAVFPAGHITASEASNYVGSRKTVCGQAVSVTYAANSTGKPTLLNFDRPYPDQLFTVVIWGQNRDNFPEPPDILYGGREVCATGLISDYQGRPQIEVALPAQMAIFQ